jgi:hypothetical protein
MTVVAFPLAALQEFLNGRHKRSALGMDAP